MKREKVLLIAKFLYEFDTYKAWPFYEFEEELGIDREIVKHSLSILKKLGTLDYQIIPFNEPPEDHWRLFAKSAGLKRPKKEDELKYHIDEEAFLADVHTDVLGGVIKSPEKITDRLLEDERFFSAPVFDEKESKIKFGEKQCSVPVSSHPFYLCKTVFSHRIGEFVSEQEILNKIDIEKNKDGKRLVYDAMLKVNRLVKQCLGLDNFMERQGNKFRIREAFLE